MYRSGGDLCSLSYHEPFYPIVNCPFCYVPTCFIVIDQQDLYGQILAWIM